MRIQPLRPGDAVAVVSPSGPSAADELDKGIAWLAARYRVVPDARRSARLGYLAGSDDARAAALCDAVADPQVRAVVAARGGYGAMRVLELAGDTLARALARDPKPLVGFSDVTALHALWSRAGVSSLHGPMVAAVGRGAVTATDREALVAALEGAPPPAWRGLEPWVDGAAEGTARGGNLAVLAALEGTPYALAARGAVLFLEDVGERPYRVDRMLTTLRLTGALRAVAGVVLGDFTDCGPGPDGVSVAEVLRERLGDLGVPVFAGGGFGHGDAHRVIPFGYTARLRPGGEVEFRAP